MVSNLRRSRALKKPNPSGRVTGDPMVLGNCKHTGRMVVGPTSQVQIHTRNGRQKRTSCSFCSLHLTETIERTQHTRTKRPCISSATQICPRSPRNLVSLTHKGTTLRTTMETPQRSSRHRKRDSDLLAEVPDHAVQFDLEQPSTKGSDSLLSQVC